MTTQPNQLLPLIVAMPLPGAVVLVGAGRRLPRLAAEVLGGVFADGTAAFALILLARPRTPDSVWGGGWTPRHGPDVGIVLLGDPLALGLTALISLLLAAALAAGLVPGLAHAVGDALDQAVPGKAVHEPRWSAAAFSWVCCPPHWRESSPRGRPARTGRSDRDPVAPLRPAALRPSRRLRSLTGRGNRAAERSDLVVGARLPLLTHPMYERGATVVRRILVAVLVVVALAVTAVTVTVSPWWWLAAAPLLGAATTGTYDVTQRRHSVLRLYPVLGHMRYLLEAIRPEMQQYFIERDYDGRPFDRDTRSTVYQRAKGVADQDPFGTELNVYEPGYEFLTHSVTPHPVPDKPATVRVGGPGCTQPYDMSLLNVSAMSFGALSAQAILALNRGAAAGGFAHDTGEGGISEYHLRHGGDLIWEIGTGYFGCRTQDGGFDEQEFARKAAGETVRCVSLKLSQGAKPGMGGVLPGAKVNAEIARVREVPEGRTVVSPSYHRVFSTPRELIRFIAGMRSLAGGKPTGFKLCVGRRSDVVALCKAMLAEDITPDFIVVDGAEGGTGAAPMEFVDHVGMPLTDGLGIVHNALVGVGLRDRVRIGASGKVATGSDIVKRLIHGADYTNAARAMMFAVGCIQSQRCHTNRCPVGVATQDPGRGRALDVEDKFRRVHRFQQATVHSAMEIMASMGVTDPAQLRPGMLQRRVSHTEVASYAELVTWLRPGQLLSGTALPPEWQYAWEAGDPDSFAAPW